MKNQKTTHDIQPNRWAILGIFTTALGLQNLTRAIQWSRQARWGACFRRF